MAATGRLQKFGLCAGSLVFWTEKGDNLSVQVNTFRVDHSTGGKFLIGTQESMGLHEEIPDMVQYVNFLGFSSRHVVLYVRHHRQAGFLDDNLEFTTFDAFGVLSLVEYPA